MPNDNQTPPHHSGENDNERFTFQTCARGEAIRHRPGGSRSLWDECTPPGKPGNSCCCGTGSAAAGHRKHCGHVPRCH